GSSAGTLMVKDIAPGSGGSAPHSLTVVGNSVFFIASTSAAGTEVWRSDGTDAGTNIVRDINPGSNQSNPDYLTELNGKLIFSAHDQQSPTANELWQSDGTPAGTSVIKFIHPGSAGSRPNNLTVAGTTMFFAANSENSTGEELWKTDGTEAGTSLVKDIYPGTNDSNPERFLAVGSSVYFRANDGSSGVELWKSDGTAAGTFRVLDARPGVSASNPANLTLYNGIVYFTADDGAHGTELWRSDGSGPGTFMVTDVFPGTGSSAPNYLTVCNGKLLFSAINDGFAGRELFVTDGTAAGTVRIDIYPGMTSSTPNSLVELNGAAIFLATSPANSNERMWRSDGTAAGTTLLGGPTSVQAMSRIGNQIYLCTFSEIWRTDGTVAGTQKVATVQPYIPSGTTRWPIADANGIVFFGGKNGIGGAGSELWRTDGTAAGTVMVKDINVGIGFNANPDLLTSVGGRVFFTATELIGGNELWSSDGTLAGTSRVQDLYPDATDSSPTSLSNFNGQLFFAADDGLYGAELYKVVGSDVIPPDFTTRQFDPAGTKLKFTFTEDVSKSLTRDDLILRDPVADVQIPISASALESYDVLTNTATFAFPGLPGGVLPSGGYSATLRAADVTDAAGNGLFRELNYHFIWVSGTPQNDLIEIRDDAAVYVQISVNGAAPFDVTAFDADAFIVRAGAGDDAILIDSSYEYPIPIGGLNVDGEAGIDALKFIAHWEHSNDDAITFSPSSIAISPDRQIDHAGVEDVTFDGNGGLDLLTVSDGAHVWIEHTQHLSSLVIGSNAFAGMRPAAGTSLVTIKYFISMQLTSIFDLNNSDLMYSYSGLTSPISALQALVNSARAGGAWTGFGITSSAAWSGSPRNTTLGLMESGEFKSIFGPSATFDGESLQGPAVLMKFTYYGDADFNGVVDFDDYSRIDAGFNNNRTGWLNGDVDGNGIVDFDDYSLIDQAFNTQGAALRPVRLPPAGKPTKHGGVAVR
ncbi:MAG: hypothetical protein H7144_07255, partial [Burkholderiales bacterium]|nr:hypothetical protein [Phycisphaerae bacterium]